jgi:cytochrome c oxidase assembly factor CtaG
MRLAALILFPGLAWAHAGEAHWSPWDIAAAISLALPAWLYFKAAPLMAWRHIGAFAAGWLALAVALLSPLDGNRSFSLHMIQHELIMIAAPPLLILGRPYAALAATLPPAALRIAALPLRVPPLAALLLHALALWIWHVPRLFDAALESAALHAAQHASFFFSALLFWWAVFRRARTGVALLYILVTMIHAGALAALLTFAPAPLYALTALGEQQLGGLIMWVPAGYAMLAAGLIAFNRILR